MTMGTKYRIRVMAFAGIGKFIIGKWMISCKEFTIPSNILSDPAKRIFDAMDPYIKPFIEIPPSADVSL